MWQNRRFTGYLTGIRVEISNSGTTVVPLIAHVLYVFSVLYYCKGDQEGKFFYPNTHSEWRGSRRKPNTRVVL